MTYGEEDISSDDLWSVMIYGEENIRSHDL